MSRRTVAGERRRRNVPPSTAARVFAVVPGSAAAWILRRATPASMRNEVAWLRGVGRTVRGAQLELALEQLERAAASLDAAPRDQSVAPGASSTEAETLRSRASTRATRTSEQRRTM